MNKKFLSVILFSALMVGTAGTFTSCKDYDDDIKDLQGQLRLLSLKPKLKLLMLKQQHKKALDKAKEALDKAGRRWIFF